MAAASSNFQKYLQHAMQLICDALAQSAGRVTDLLREWDTDQNGLIDKKEVRADGARARWEGIYSDMHRTTALSCSPPACRVP